MIKESRVIGRGQAQGYFVNSIPTGVEFANVQASAIERPVEPFSGLLDALQEWAWENLNDYHPKHAEGLKMAVEAGATPDEIRNWVMNQMGDERTAKKMRLAASYLANEEA